MRLCLTFCDSGNPPNLSQDTKIEVLDPAIFPNKTYLKTSILAVSNYAILKGLEGKMMSSHKKEITIDELIDQYYSNPEDYFSPTDSKNVYSQTSENKDKSHETSEHNIESISPETKVSDKLGGIDQSPNNLVFPHKDTATR